MAQVRVEVQEQEQGEEELIFRALYIPEPTPEEDGSVATTSGDDDLSDKEKQEVKDVAEQLPDFAPALNAATTGMTQTYQSLEGPLREFRNVILRLNEVDRSRNQLTGRNQEEFNAIRVDYASLIDAIDVFRVNEVCTLRELHDILRMMVESDQENREDAAEECYRQVLQIIHRLNLSECQRIIALVNALRQRIDKLNSMVMTSAEIDAKTKEFYNSLLSAAVASVAVMALPVFWPMEVAALCGYALAGGAFIAGITVTAYAASAALKVDEHLKALTAKLQEAQAGLGDIRTCMHQIREQYVLMRGDMKLNQSQCAYLRRLQREKLEKLVKCCTASAIEALESLKNVTIKDPFAADAETPSEQHDEGGRCAVC